MSGNKLGRRFEASENPLQGVKVEIPQKPLLMEALENIKISVGIETKFTDNKGFESVEKRQSRELRINDF